MSKKSKGVCSRFLVVSTVYKHEKHTTASKKNRTAHSIYMYHIQKLTEPCLQQAHLLICKAADMLIFVLIRVQRPVLYMHD